MGGRASIAGAGTTDIKKLAIVGFAVAALADSVSHALVHGIGYILAYITARGLLPASMVASGVVGLLSDLVELYFVALITPYAIKGSVPQPSEALRDWRAGRLVHCLAILMILRGISLAIWPNTGAGVLEVISAVVLALAFSMWCSRSDYRPTFLLGSVLLTIAGFAGAPPLINVHLGLFGIALLIPAVAALFYSTSASRSRGLSGGAPDALRSLANTVSAIIASTALIAGGAQTITEFVSELRVLGWVCAGGVIGIIGGVIALLVGIVALIASLTRLHPHASPPSQGGQYG